MIPIPVNKTQARIIRQPIKQRYSKAKNEQTYRKKYYRQYKIILMHVVDIVFLHSN